MSTDTTPVLSVEGLSKSFGGIHAVQDVSFDVAVGELLALIGPNGAGKTTCFNMLMGQLPTTSGVVRLNGETITGLKPRQIWRCLLYTSPSPRDRQKSRMPSSA